MFKIISTAGLMMLLTLACNDAGFNGGSKKKDETKLAGGTPSGSPGGTPSGTPGGTQDANPAVTDTTTDTGSSTDTDTDTAKKCSTGVKDVSCILNGAGKKQIQVDCADKDSAACKAVTTSAKKLLNASTESTVHVKNCSDFCETVKNLGQVTIDDGAKTVGTSTDKSGSIAEGDGEKICNPGKRGYGGKVYRLAPKTQALPNLTAMTPIGQVTSPTLDVPRRAFENGFPGVPDLNEWFAIRFFGELTLPADGDYYFATNSDDGSKLYVGGKLVVSNDNIHEPRRIQSGAVSLKKGTTSIVVEWYQGPRKYIALQVYWKRPGSPFEIIPASFVEHGGICDLPDIGTFE